MAEYALWPGIKRARSDSTESDYTFGGKGCEAYIEPYTPDSEWSVAREAAAVLLSFKLARVDDHGFSSAQLCTASCTSSDTGDMASPSNASKSRDIHSKSKFPQTTRQYVWRGPRGKTVRRADTVTSFPRQTSLDTAQSTESMIPTAPVCELSDNEKCEQEDGADAKQGDKGWAALTTWLRMNLHHPRTNKRQVLFVGQQNPQTRHWTFDLNPALTWDDVSVETKARLKTLVSETEQAFMQKYPNRPSSDWVKKSQKYRQQGSGMTFSVPLSEMIHSLVQIFYKYEGQLVQQDLGQQQQPKYEVVQPASCTYTAAMAGCGLPEQAVYVAYAGHMPHC
mmetsp:Transcript_24782/g.54034  ORF Transcript_24782/g.54034 Transcript_24782/m.54034 type:complete len:337 (+) Transcript_24782:146-1156(+)|eukprot:CAMPEP_0202901162 /NCGR_PEP_ID=MMETSP1392-20130828/13686_1 /ASSEMBLY_ACC=CAM_ASM_000868 /TAXON_ID=225041 /ORGANISM="Chlamydomonas chlamydogama, Strain SAG 11-48b" /LENGTH=336 /DNA_ID=CAMNT_0049587675 /DNA_START=146 /DNA_END=1156 /DNA_ORIENTATION=+